MKVTHVLYLSEIAGHSPLSGAENHLWVLLPALARAGASVELLAVLWRGRDFARVRRKIAELAEQGVSITLLERGTQTNPLAEACSKLRTWLKLGGCLWRRRAHVIHLHLEMAYTPFIAWAVGCRKLICTLHNDEPAFRQPAAQRRLQLVNRIIRHFIAITEHVRAYYCRATGARPERVTTVYYGLPAPHSPPAARREFAIPEAAFVVGYVGRLTAQKNLAVFLAALRQRPHLLGVVVGDGPQRAELEEQAARDAIHNVMFLGAIPDAARLMPLCDVLCLPSLWEGLGLVLLEAMLRRVPVMGSRRGAIPEILVAGEYGLLFEPTAAGLGAALDEAFARPAELRARAAAAYNYASQKFTVARMVQATLQLYRSL